MIPAMLVCIDLLACFRMGFNKPLKRDRTNRINDLSRDGFRLPRFHPHNGLFNTVSTSVLHLLLCVFIAIFSPNIGFIDFDGA